MQLALVDCTSMQAAFLHGSHRIQSSRLDKQSRTQSHNVLLAFFFVGPLCNPISSMLVCCTIAAALKKLLDLLPQELKLQYGANKGKAYTEEEDRFILCQVHLLGYGQWDELKAAIRDHWRFRFDWFFKSRTPQASCAALCGAVLCCPVLCRPVLCFALLCPVTLCGAVLCCAALCCTVLCDSHPGLSALQFTRGD